MKATDNPEKKDDNSIISEKPKKKLTKMKTRLILVTIIVLVVLAALVYFKPVEQESTIDTQYYSDLESSVPVFNKATNDKEVDSSTPSIESSPEPSAETPPEDTKEAETANESVADDSDAPVDEKPAEPHTDAMAGDVAPMPTPEKITQPEENTGISNTGNSNGEIGTTDLPPAPTPDTFVNPKPDNQKSVDFDKDIVSYQEKMLEDLYKNKAPKTDNTTVSNQFEKIEYAGKKQDITYVEGEQVKIYMYKNFAVKIFLGTQPNKKQLEGLDYFINGSDNSSAFTVRLLKNNTILLSKNEAEQTWGGTDLFMTAGDRTYSFIILPAQTPSERTDSIRYKTSSTITSSSKK